MTEKVKVTPVFAGFYKTTNGYFITNVYGGWYVEEAGTLRTERKRFNTFAEAKEFVKGVK